VNAAAEGGALSVAAHQAAIDAEIERAAVVIFRSPLSDIRALTERLRQAGIDFHEVVLGMASYAMRERFHVLQAQTGWSTLPLVFVSGRFVGGVDELMHHPLLDAGPTAETVLDAPDVRVRAQQLGWLGLLPFVAGALLPWFVSDAAARATLLDLTLGYAAVILSFVGAVHWGRALSGAPGAAAWLVYSVVPALTGWLVLAAAGAVGLVALAGAFVLAYWADRKAYQGVPRLRWFLRLRGRISAAVIASLLIAAVGHGLVERLAL